MSGVPTKTRSDGILDFLTKRSIATNPDVDRSTRAQMFVDSTSAGLGWWSVSRLDRRYCFPRSFPGDCYQISGGIVEDAMVV